MDQFTNLDLTEKLLAAVSAAGFKVPTPVQAKAIPPALAGRDLLVSAQTGSGKTASFVLPLLQRLTGDRQSRQSGAPRALILAPTRELAAQIGDSIHLLGRGLNLKHAVVFGGVGKQPQISVLRRGVEILVATPGRLLDLMGEDRLTLAHVQTIIIDEADRMLDMGFLPDVKRIVATLPSRRQSLFFSATLPDEIVSLASNLLRDPIRVQIESTAATTPDIDQKLMFLAKEDKKAALLDLLVRTDVRRTLVFTRTKHGAKRVAHFLDKRGISTDSLHGDKGQTARRTALSDFNKGRIRVLVATDVASRGLDVDDIDHVVNFELPYEPEVYVHRIGRTARAGKTGKAFSFCDSTELTQLAAIERLLGAAVAVDGGHPHHSDETLARRKPLGGGHNTRGVPSGRARPKRTNGGQFRTGGRGHSSRTGPRSSSGMPRSATSRNGR